MITSGLRGVKTLGSISTLGITSTSGSSSSDSDSSCVGFSVSSPGMIQVFLYGYRERGSGEGVKVMNEMINFLVCKESKTSRSDRISGVTDSHGLRSGIMVYFAHSISLLPSKSTII